MKSFFWGLTVILIILGFLMPFFWIAGFITFILAIVSAPSGAREDGKPKTGGLLGGIYDSAVIAHKMKECPYCKAQIVKSATVCRYCAREVEFDSAQSKIKDGAQRDARDIYRR